MVLKIFILIAKSMLRSQLYMGSYIIFSSIFSIFYILLNQNDHPKRHITTTKHIWVFGGEYLALEPQNESIFATHKTYLKI